MAAKRHHVIVEEGTWAEHRLNVYSASSNPKELGKYLVKLRKKADVTQADVAEGTGISQGYVSQLELGKRGIPRPELMFRISQFHGIAAESLWVVAGFPMKPMGPVEPERLGLDEQFRRLINHESMQGVFKQGDEQWISPLVKRRWLQFAARLIVHCQDNPDVTFDYFLADTAYWESEGEDVEVGTR